MTRAPAIPPTQDEEPGPEEGPVAAGGADGTARPVAASASAAGSVLPYGTDSERDRQVRARLAELAAGADISVEELLEQLDKARAFGLPVPADLDPLPGAGGTQTSGPATVLNQRPGDGEWGVDSLIFNGVAAQPRPCAGEKICPWRRDAPADQFPARVYVHSAPGNRASGPDGRFGCHSSGNERPLLCAGWLLAGADGNEDILQMLRTGALNQPELPQGVQLYDSYAEMAIAAGVDPALPALYARPAPTGRSDFAPLQSYQADRHAQQEQSTGHHEHPEHPERRRP
ncbi:DUF6283 family protein [Streptomyces sp. NPDC005962]|uniref:DUF6283 family protein n=1 Tax=Streptomyces sp. NPDC005962 TaxID=3154466 RepID=UPI0033CAA6E1